MDRTQSHSIVRKFIWLLGHETFLCSTLWRMKFIVLNDTKMVGIKNLLAEYENIFIGDFNLDFVSVHNIDRRV